MSSNLPDGVVRTLDDRSVLDHKLVEADEKLVLMVKVRPHDARKLRERLEHELSRSGAHATVVLNSSERQELDVSKWRRSKPTPLKPVNTLRLGTYFPV